MTPRSIAAALILLLTACDLTPKIPGAEQRSAISAQANARELKRACASQSTYDRLKSAAFDDALKVREANSPVLDRIAAGTVLRMQDPVVKSRDVELNVTVCSGRMILELPPGIEDAFGGKRRLEADIEYSAQEAIDGSGLVYEMQGAEPIVYRLAAIDFKRVGPPEPMVARSPGAVPTPEAAPLPPPIEVAAAPALPPQVEQRPTPPRPTPTTAIARPSPVKRPQESIARRKVSKPVRESVAAARPSPVKRPQESTARRKVSRPVRDSVAAARSSSVKRSQESTARRKVLKSTRERVAAARSSRVNRSQESTARRKVLKSTRERVAAARSSPVKRPQESAARRKVPKSARERVAAARPSPIKRPQAQIARRRIPVPPRERVAARPSFSCRYAQSRSERLICSDRQLARQDRAMSSEFYDALAEADGWQRAELRSSRDRFLRDRERCASAECVARANDDRIEEIRAIREE